MDIVNEQQNESSNEIIEKVRQGDKKAFEKLFYDYYSNLHSFACQFIDCEERAKDIVQDVFVKIWKRRKTWKIHRSLKAYLLKAVRNNAINQINHNNHRSKVRETFLKERPRLSVKPVNAKSNKYDRLIEKIWDTVIAMPARRRRVFILYHRQGLSYNEIADVLDINRKTVENHMGLALKDIRAQIDQKRANVG